MNTLIFKAPHPSVTLRKGEPTMYGNKENEQSTPNKYITCPYCGEQIPMVPALSDMIQSIENHLTSHKEGSYPKHDPIQHPKKPNLSEDLAEQVLMRAAEIGETLSKEPAITLHSTDS